MLVPCGASNKEIAANLYIRPNQPQVSLRGAISKLNSHPPLKPSHRKPSFSFSPSARKKFPHNFGGRCNGWRSEIEAPQFDGKTSEIHSSQMLVTRQKQPRSEKCTFGHQL